MRNKTLYTLLCVIAVLWMNGRANAYTITATASPGGTMAPTGVINVSGGAIQVVHINPSAGYHVVDVLVDAVSVGGVAGYTFSAIAADHTISASFDATIYTITATASPGGIIFPAGAISPLYYDGNQSFVATPNAGYQVASMLVNGVSSGPSSSYEFSNIRSDQTIAVAFEPYAASAYGKVTLRWDRNVLDDSYLGGYILKYGKISGDYSFFSIDVGKVNQYTLTNIDLYDPIFFAATAYTTYGNPIQRRESAPSTELVCFSLVPVQPSVGAISPSRATIVSIGQSASYTISMGGAGGSHLLDVLVNGASTVSPTTDLLFENINQTKTIYPIIAPLMLNSGSRGGGLATGGLFH